MDGNDKQLISQQNDVVSAMIEMEAMKAKNRICEIRGEYPTYDEDSFRKLMDDYNLGFYNNQNKRHAWHL